ncbi:ATP-binding cassette domain-containing protein [Galbibacter mesophilus]|uniref:ATP-binding cassette domain-containing protein n=1 Tax=Galbibacter mesophilus TaxID=379069 RepID=UPI00191FD617|nr:ATP-binding cassette domain-containing protein [Galbibacter mesophilus]MCM5663145.1 ATP-binding cassette domain-containing protein [Galbibacter mesophilus]
MIIAEGVCKNYRNRRVLSQTHISCERGQIVGLLGKNGAGKTTLFKILLGLVKPNSGKVTINSSHVKPLGGIIEKPSLYEYLNAKDNLKVFSEIQGLHLSDAELNEQLDKVGLSNDRTDAVKNYSMGMKQRLGIAVALLNHPEYLILDEPFSGLDPMGIKSLRELILGLIKKENIGIIISSHIIEELNKICDNLYIINEGKIINYGQTQEIITKHTQAFTLYASGIEHAKTLGEYRSSVRKNSAVIFIPPQQLADLLQKLAQEEIVVTACIPEINFDTLLQREL